MERGDEDGSTDPCLEERPEADPGFLIVSLNARFKETGDPFAAAVGAVPESEVLIRNADAEEVEEEDAVGDGWPLLLLGASSRLPRRDRA